MTPPDTPTITAEEEALDRLTRFAVGHESGFVVYPGGIFCTTAPNPFYEDLRALLALSRRALASGAGGERETVAKVIARLATYYTGVGNGGNESYVAPNAELVVHATDDIIALFTYQPPEPKPVPDHGALVARLERFAKACETPREQDDEWIGDYMGDRAPQDIRDLVRLADALASAPSGGVGEVPSSLKLREDKRDHLGRVVREAWVRWARAQPNPKMSWLLPYDELSEPDKEADRQIGEHVLTYAFGSVSPLLDPFVQEFCKRLNALVPPIAPSRAALAPTNGGTK